MPTSTSNPSTSPAATTTIPPETLETDLLSHLTNTTALEDLHTTILCSLQRMGWTEKVRKLTVELLRAGGCEGFDDAVEAVLASAEEDGHKALKEAGRDPETRTYFENVDVKIPKVVVEQGVKALKEAIGEIVVLDEEEGSGKDEGEQAR